MNPTIKEKGKRRRTIRVPDALYEEALKEITGNNDLWFSVTLREVIASENNTTIISVDIEGEDKFRENRWKRFTMEV